MKTVAAQITATVAATLALVSVSLRAADLTIRATPSDTAPVLARITGDRTPSVITLPTPPPEGWTAVEVPGPHTVYVADKDVLKNYDVRPGAHYLAEAREDSAILGLAGPTDETELSGIEGKFTQYKLNRPFVGYIRSGAAPASQPAAASADGATPAPAAAQAASGSGLPPIPAPRPEPVITVGSEATGGTLGSGAAIVPLQTPASAPAASTPPPPLPAPAAGAAPVALVPAATPPPAVVTPAPVPATTPAPAGAASTQDSLGLPRMILGTFVSSKQAFRPRRPYDYQLNDDGGTRYAYVDLSRLLLTEQIDRFIGRKVVVFGPIRPISGTKDIVILAETLKLQ